MVSGTNEINRPTKISLNGEDLEEMESFVYQHHCDYKYHSSRMNQAYAQTVHMPYLKTTVLWVDH